MIQVNPTLITPEILSVLDNLDLIAGNVVEGFLSGLHRSPFLGYSSEFSSYRPYIQGDNLRYVDWKGWARTDQYYIKQFEDDTNMHCHLFLDSSESMNMGGVNKFQFGKILAAALGYLMVRQNDAPGLTLFGQSVQESIPSNGGSQHLEDLFLLLVRAVSKGQTAFSTDLNQIVNTFQRRGLSVIISDLFVGKDEILQFLKHIRFHSTEVILFHVHSREEVEFDFNGDYIIEDSETGLERRVNATKIRKKYLQRLHTFCDGIQNECQKLEIDYHQVQTHRPLDTTLAKYLEWRSLIRR